MTTIDNSIVGSVLTNRFVYIHQAQEEYKANISVKYSQIYKHFIAQHHPETILQRAFLWSYSPEGQEFWSEIWEQIVTYNAHKETLT